MPLYEYQCKDCGAIIEKIQKFSNTPLRKCAKCGGRLERLLSSPAIQFKGSGFYITDYARKSASDGGKSPATSGNASAKPDGAKATESKSPEPAKKAEPSPVTK